MKIKKKCGYCGKLKEVYGQEEIEFDGNRPIPKRELLTKAKGRLHDGDIVGLPICRECYENLGG
jgi:hypothetical protein